MKGNPDVGYLRRGRKSASSFSRATTRKQALNRSSLMNGLFLGV